VIAYILHDQFGVADPDHVDHAEHQVEAERQQCQQSAQQQPVEHGFKQEYVEYLHQIPR
jgi:hypothetical protein